MAREAEIISGAKREAIGPERREKHEKRTVMVVTRVVAPLAQVRARSAWLPEELDMRKFVAVVFALGLLSGPAFAEDDTAACLSACTKRFAECTKGGPATKPCLEARKKCIETCGDS